MAWHDEDDRVDGSGDFWALRIGIAALRSLIPLEPLVVNNGTSNNEKLWDDDDNDLARFARGRTGKSTTVELGSVSSPLNFRLQLLNGSNKSRL